MRINIAAKTFTLEPPSPTNLTWTVFHLVGNASFSGGGGSVSGTAASAGTGDDAVGAQVQAVSSDFYVCSEQPMHIDYTYTINGPGYTFNGYYGWFYPNPHARPNPPG